MGGQLPIPLYDRSRLRSTQGRGENTMPRNILITLALLLTFVSAASAQGQKPMVLDESTVVAGTQRTPTQYVYAMGKWSDATDAALSNSTEIHCYQAFGFCEVASADSVGGGVYVKLDTFDILR